LTNLSSIPLPLLDLPSSFAPHPIEKPYFPRQVNSLLRVSDAQSKAKSKEGKETGEIWGTKELKPWFEQGAGLIAKDEARRNVGSVVHGDFKMDNLVSHPNHGLSEDYSDAELLADGRSSILQNLGLSVSWIGNYVLSVHHWLISGTSFSHSLFPLSRPKTSNPSLDRLPPVPSSPKNQGAQVVSWSASKAKAAVILVCRRRKRLKSGGWRE
jgi:hypothetical protein